MLVLVDQFLNFTDWRADMFYPMDGKLGHVDAADLYCWALHEQLAASAEKLRIRFVRGAAYVCMNGRGRARGPRG
jgi:purine nucleoside phosphorylase